jgi:segregation and condensation protein A
MHTTVARFLALLELFREGAVGFEQLTPLGELTVRWIGTDDGELAISDEFDEAASSEQNTGAGSLR